MIRSKNSYLLEYRSAWASEQCDVSITFAAFPLIFRRQRTVRAREKSTERDRTSTFFLRRYVHVLSYMFQGYTTPYRQHMFVSVYVDQKSRIKLIINYVHKDNVRQMIYGESRQRFKQRFFSPLDSLSITHCDRAPLYRIIF